MPPSGSTAMQGGGEASLQRHRGVIEPSGETVRSDGASPRIHGKGGVDSPVPITSSRHLLRPRCKNKTDPDTRRRDCTRVSRVEDSTRSSEDSKTESESKSSTLCLTENECGMVFGLGERMDKAG